MPHFFEEHCASFRRRISAGEMLDNTNELLKLELGQTFPCYHASAEKTLEILKKYGIPNAEKITFPADGKTAYQDKTTPLGWDISVGKLVIEKADGIPAGTVIADYAKHPFHIVKGCTATKPGGETFRVITDAQMLAGVDAANALILAPPRTTPTTDFITRFLDMGAAGFITDYAKNAKEAPDGIQWCNAYTETGTWHITAEDRPFLGFSITAADAQDLRGALARGPVTVHAESDGRRYESTVDVVTAMVPGKRKEEFWLLAHLYEPLGNDNSSGVSAAIETARMIMQQGTPEFSLRVVFGLEHYGFAAYASTRGTNLSKEVIGGINYDAMYLRNGWGIELRGAPPGTPFYGNYLFEEFSKELNGKPGMPEIPYLCQAKYTDDSFLGDSTTGVPVLWPIRTGKNFWHNSKQTIDYVEKEAFATGCCINAAVTDAIINPRKEFLADAVTLAKERLHQELNCIVGSAKEHLTRRYDICMQDLDNFKRYLSESDITQAKAEVTKTFETLVKDLSDEIPHSPWRDYAAKIVPSRLTTGFPYDRARAPFRKRKRMVGGILYSEMVNILADMDGKRNLAELFRMAEHELRRELSESEIKMRVQDIFYLARYDYISLGDFKGLTKDDVVAALRSAGIKKGDLLAVHSSVSEPGLIEGGPATLFEALKEVVGPEGTFMTPALVSCFVNIGGPNTSKGFHPYDRHDPSIVWTGSLPRFLLNRPDVLHTMQITHSWCIYGPKAQEIGGDQKINDSPCGPESPLMRMMRMGGKVVHLGSKISSTTFLHCIEDALDLPGIQDTLCMMKTPGSTTPVAVPRNLPGCRDFYHGDETTAKFFVEAVKRGLKITKVPFGLSFVRVMDLQQLFRIGCEIAKQDPYIFLCDPETCVSCRRLKSEYDGRVAFRKQLELEGVKK